MRRMRIIAAVIAIAASAMPAFSQASERVQQMNRIVDGIASPDPVTRLVTLEEAMASKDKNLQRVALSAAFASSDLTLRQAAVEAAFAAKRSFVIEFTGVAKGTNPNDTGYWTRSGGQIEVRFEQFNKETGEFIGYTAFSSKTNGAYDAGEGNLSGDRLSFDISVHELYAGDWCSGAVTSKPGETVMTGSMSCDNYGYTIKVDLLR